MPTQGSWRPVVSTTIGAEGLVFENGSQIVIADDPAAFARACVRLLTDAQQRRLIGSAARAKACEIYSAQGVQARLLSLFADVCRGR